MRCSSGLPRGEAGPDAYNYIFLRSKKHDCPLGVRFCSRLEPHSPRDRWRGEISASVPSAPGFPSSLFRGPCGPRAPCLTCEPWPVGTPPVCGLYIVSNCTQPRGPPLTPLRPGRSPSWLGRPAFGPPTTPQAQSSQERLKAAVPIILGEALLTASVQAVQEMGDGSHGFYSSDQWHSP